MGEIIRFTHRDCKFRFDFHEGNGFSLFRAQCNARENMRSGKWGEHWKSLLEQFPSGTATLQNAICHCPNCNKIYTEPRIEFYIPKEGKEYTFDERNPDMVPTYYLYDNYDILEKEIMICPDCKGEATVIEDYNKLPCPKCGKLLKGRSVGMWD